MNYLYYGAMVRARMREKQAAELNWLQFDLQFERAYQLFVVRGGLDAVHARAEDLDRFYAGTRPDPDKCIHGLTHLTCAQCYLTK